MNGQLATTMKNVAIALTSLMLGLAALGAGASENSSLAEGTQLIYNSHSANHGIHTYPSNLVGEVSLHPEIIYVSQAYGPAIHSYHHTGSETSVPWNVEYVDTAHGQAIYSYERVRAEGSLELLPVARY
ncbi:hypothetical protein [Methylomarinum vadi]|uniref:hypothetical protein n=1 Tax=Methylomarinum vadi TaxID=438855 RepID=UPI000A03385D|nr:hypothetical protein [Methylomarinum vadi]